MNPEKHAAYAAHHPLAKHAGIKSFFTTLKPRAKSSAESAAAYLKSPAVLFGTAAGLAGGAYFGNKAFREKSEIPAARTLPRLEQQSYIHPEGQV